VGDAPGFNPGTAQRGARKGPSGQDCSQEKVLTWLINNEGKQPDVWGVKTPAGFLRGGCHPEVGGSVCEYGVWQTGPGANQKRRKVNVGPGGKDDKQCRMAPGGGGKKAEGYPWGGGTKKKKKIITAPPGLRTGKKKRGAQPAGELFRNRGSKTPKKKKMGLAKGIQT